MTTPIPVQHQPLLDCNAWFHPPPPRPMPLVEEMVRLVSPLFKPTKMYKKSVIIMTSEGMLPILGKKRDSLYDGKRHLWSPRDYEQLSDGRLDLFGVSSSGRTWNAGMSHRCDIGSSSVFIDGKTVYRKHPDDEMQLGTMLWLDRLVVPGVRKQPDEIERAPFLSALIDRIIDIYRSVPGCYQAWIDCELAKFIAYGHLYSPSQVYDLNSWRHAIEQVNWNNAGPERRGRVRAPVWGTYLGPELASKLGDPHKFIRDYDKWAAEDRDAKHLKPFERVRLFDDGALFIRVSDNPYDTFFHCSAGWDNHDAVRNAGAWLWERYRGAGMV